MLVTMEEKAKAQVLKSFYAYMKLMGAMDEIYGFDRIKDTLEHLEERTLKPDTVRVLTAVNDYIKHGVLSHHATSIIDVKAKEDAQRAIIEARKQSRVEEYMEKREKEKGESDLEYYTGILGAAYGNVVATYDLRNDGRLNNLYDKFIDVMDMIDWKDINETDVDSVMKQGSNAYFAASTTVTSSFYMKATLSAQNFMCNYAGVNKFVSILVACELVKQLHRVTFKPNRVGEEIGNLYLEIFSRASKYADTIAEEVRRYHDTCRLYETGQLDLTKMTVEMALDLSYRNTVMLPFVVPTDDENDADTLAMINEYNDSFIIDEWTKGCKDKKYKPKFYRIVAELIYNEKALVMERLKTPLNNLSDDAPRLRVTNKDGSYNALKDTIKEYHKTHKAMSRWIVDQFELDWDSGVYNDKRNGVTLTIPDKSKAKNVFNIK